MPTFFTWKVYVPVPPTLMLAGPVLVTVRSNEFTGVVSEKLSLPVLPGGSLPPLMLTVLVMLGTAPLLGTATFTVMALGLLVPGFITVAFVQTTRPPPTMLSPASGVLAVQVHPVPAGRGATRVSPEGSGSMTV